MPRSHSMRMDSSEVNRERATPIKQSVPALRYALTVYLFLSIGADHEHSEDDGGTAGGVSGATGMRRQRQAKRVSLWLSTGCALALTRLARPHGSTQREFLEKLVLAEDDKVLATMALDSPEWSAYFQSQSMRARAGAAPHAGATPEA